MKSGSCGNGACDDLSPLRCVAEVVVRLQKQQHEPSGRGPVPAILVVSSRHATSCKVLAAGECFRRNRCLLKDVVALSESDHEDRVSSVTCEERFEMSISLVEDIDS